MTKIRQKSRAYGEQNETLVKIANNLARSGVDRVRESKLWRVFAMSKCGSENIQSACRLIFLNENHNHVLQKLTNVFFYTIRKVKIRVNALQNLYFQHACMSIFLSSYRIDMLEICAQHIWL